MSKEFPEELIRKVSKTVIHASEKGKRSLFERLTSDNAEKLEEVSKEEPILYENKEGAEQKILLDDEIAGLFPEDFFENPTEWIESQKPVERGHNMLPVKSIEGLWEFPYDVSKVKQFTLELPDGQKKIIVSKRIDRRQLEEIRIARMAYQSGIPTPKLLGEIIDRGNTYALFEYVLGINMLSAKEKTCGSIENFDLLFDALPNDINYLDDPGESDALADKLKSSLSGIISSDKIESLINDLINLRNKYAIHILRREIFVRLKCIEARDQLEEIRDIKNWGLFKRFGSESVQTESNQILIALGYRDLEDYIIRVSNLSNEEKDELLRKIDGLIKSTVNNYINEFIASMKSRVMETLFGFDVFTEMNILEELCTKAGIPHKDFSWRNLIIPWDFDKDKPAVEGGDKPKLYVIDWEQEKSSNKK
ncbi:MAG: hypothetical protein WC705_00250 [Candidatus Paceibacterota bacterium]|jgi:hypothetical protein